MADVKEDVGLSSGDKRVRERPVSVRRRSFSSDRPFSGTLLQGKSSYLQEEPTVVHAPPPPSWERVGR